MCNVVAVPNPCPIRSTQMNLKVVQKTVAANLLGGNFLTEYIISFYNKASLGNPSIFIMPQMISEKLESTKKVEVHIPNESFMEVQMHRG